jgi:hypothetical protein
VDFGLEDVKLVIAPNVTSDGVAVWVVLAKAEGCEEVVASLTKRMYKKVIGEGYRGEPIFQA